MVPARTDSFWAATSGTASDTAASSSSGRCSMAGRHLLLSLSCVSSSGQVQGADLLEQKEGESRSRRRERAGAGEQGSST